MHKTADLRRIFVQIASYRDPELPRTVEDCLAKATHPERLHFGICWQFDQATRDDLESWSNDARFRIDKIDALDSKGCCWARNRVNRLYEGEHFTLQIDAHMRFAQDWDERFIRMFERTNEDLAILSTYPPSYTISDGSVTLTQLDHVPVLRLERLAPDLTTRQGTSAVEAPEGPVSTHYLAAGLLFAPGRFCRDVEYDPEGYFGGEEINLAVRAYSHGYKFFSPDENLVWHLYDHLSPKHWSDNPTEQTGSHNRAIKRLETLLLGDHRSLGKYGLGSAGTVADFEQQAGISFSEAKAGRLQKEEFHFHGLIELHTDEIPDREDYDSWVFCLLDEDENELYRNDINDPEVLLKRRSTVAVDTVLEGRPSHYLLWPHSGEGFGERLIYEIKDAEPVVFKRRLKLFTDDIPDRGDYDFWVFCLLDGDGKEIFRKDIYDADVLSKHRDTLDIDVNLPTEPTHYLLWPKTEEMWFERMVYPIGGSVAAGQSYSKSVVRQARNMDDSSTIFVAIASYCESELLLTLRNCITSARHPERLRFGICLQYDEVGPFEIGRNCIDEFKDDVRFRILKYDYRFGKGGSWARNLVQSLYRNERYTLQVDAHTRFVEDWDVVLIDMLEKLPSGKPLITGFPPLYLIDQQGRETFTDLDHPERVPTTVIEHWSPEGWVHHPTQFIARNTLSPRRTRVISGALVFTRGSWNTEVTQDPSAYFTGEEFALTLRSYTCGYDLFNPTRIVVWHRGHPQPNRKHFTDVSNEIAHRHNALAYVRLRTLLAGDPERVLGCFSLGSERTLEEYYRFSGLNCREFSIHPDARNGVPPNPLTVMSGDAPHPVPSVRATLYLRDSDPVTLPCHDHELALDELLSILQQRAASGESSKRVRHFRFADRTLRLRESDLVSVKIDKAG